MSETETVSRTRTGLYTHRGELGKTHRQWRATVGQANYRVADPPLDGMPFRARAEESVGSSRGTDVATAVGRRHRRTHMDSGLARELGRGRSGTAARRRAA